MNKKRLIALAVIPIIGLGIIGASQVSAFGRFSTANPEEMALSHETMFQEQAELFGVDVNKIKDAWANGKTMKDLSAELGISEEVIRQKMEDRRKTEMKSQLQILVEKGVITQVQADKRMEVAQNKFGQNIGRGGRARGGGFGMMGL